jgi:hypothetical protein
MGGRRGGTGARSGGTGGAIGGTGVVIGGSGGTIGGTAGSFGGTGGTVNLGIGGRNCHNPGPGTCCDYDRCMSPEEAALEAAKGMGFGGAPDSAQAGAGGEPTSPLCPEIQYNWLCGFYHPGVVEQDGQCCYVVNSGGCCGRPFLVAGAARQADVAVRRDWLAPACEATESVALSDVERAELRQAWLADALLEHASIASFARFTLELLSLGAPAHLIEASQCAGLDEVRHAQACFGLASRFAQQPLGPSALPMNGVELAATSAALAVAALREGCIGETLAAALARAQLELVGDAACRAALELIAHDEAQHSLLAWRTVKHALDLGGAEVARAIRAALDEGAPLPAERPSRSTPLEVWNHYGRLTSVQEQGVIEETWREVIAPALELLLEPFTLRAAAVDAGH